MSSLWQTIVPAVAALTGVGLTLLVQGRREKWRLQRDQDRDRELWAREDRQRFIETKRSAYADFLLHLGELDRVLTYSQKTMNDVRGHPGADPEPFDSALLWHGAGIDEQVERQGHATERVRYALQLIAPLIVSTIAEQVCANYLLTIVRAIAGKDAEFEEARQAFRTSRLRLVQLMREDLGVVDRLRSSCPDRC